MIKHISLVWKRRELSDAQFRRIWLGDHVDYARRLPGIREYIIDFVSNPPRHAPSAIATLRFDNYKALEAAFNDSQLRENLLRTREQFAEAIQVMIVDECVVVPGASGEAEGRTLPSQPEPGLTRRPGPRRRILTARARPDGC